VLLYAFVAVLVVDFAGFIADENFVGFGYADELLFSFIVATVIWLVNSGA
jgi:hypothetical protein